MCVICVITYSYISIYNVLCRKCGNSIYDILLIYQHVCHMYLSTKTHAICHPYIPGAWTVFKRSSSSPASLRHFTKDRPSISTPPGEEHHSQKWNHGCEISWLVYCGGKTSTHLNEMRVSNLTAKRTRTLKQMRVWSTCNNGCWSKQTTVSKWFKTLRYPLSGNG